MSDFTIMITVGVIMPAVLVLVVKLKELLLGEEPYKYHHED